MDTITEKLAADLLAQADRNRAKGRNATADLLEQEAYLLAHPNEFPASR